MVMRNREQSRSDGRIRVSLRVAAWWCLLAAAFLLVIGGFRIAAVVFVPIVAGLVLAMFLNPLTEYLSNAMPRWLACTLSMIVPTLVIVLVGWFVWFAGQQVVDHAETLSTRQYVAKWQEMRSWLSSHGVPESWLPDSTEAGEGGRAAAWQEGEARDGEAQGGEGEGSLLGGLSQETRGRLLNIVTGGLGSIAAGVVAVGFSLVFCFLAMIEAPRWSRWVQSWGSPARTSYTFSVVWTWSRQARRYLLAKTVTGVVSGTATGLFLWIMGVPLAAVWGGLTFLLNYIPNIGALISGIPPTLLAIVELGAGEAVIVALGLITIEVLSGNLLDPLLQGDFLNLSPFLMLASLLFWGWVWGILGALLAPLLTAGAITALTQVRVRPKASANAWPESRERERAGRGEAHPAAG